MAQFMVLNGRRAKSPFGMKQHKPRDPMPRDDRIRMLREKGATYSSIAKQFDLSIPRVAQICTRDAPKKDLSV